MENHDLSDVPALAGLTLRRQGSPAEQVQVAGHMGRAAAYVGRDGAGAAPAHAPACHHSLRSGGGSGASPTQRMIHGEGSVSQRAVGARWAQREPRQRLKALGMRSRCRPGGAYQPAGALVRPGVCLDARPQIPRCTCARVEKPAREADAPATVDHAWLCPAGACPLSSPVDHGGTAS